MTVCLIMLAVSVGMTSVQAGLTEPIGTPTPTTPTTTALYPIVTWSNGRGVPAPTNTTAVCPNDEVIIGLAWTTSFSSLFSPMPDRIVCGTVSALFGGQDQRFVTRVTGSNLSGNGRLRCPQDTWAAAARFGTSPSDVTIRCDRLTVQEGTVSTGQVTNIEPNRNNTTTLIFTTDKPGSTERLNSGSQFLCGTPGSLVAGFDGFQTSSPQGNIFVACDQPQAALANSPPASSLSPPGSFNLNPPTARCDGLVSVIDLAWSLASDAVTYRVERMANSASFDPIGTVAQPQTNFSDRTTIAGQSYTYRIVAKNTTGETASNLTNATALSCLAIPAPTQPTANPTPTVTVTVTPPAASPTVPTGVVVRGDVFAKNSLGTISVIGPSVVAGANSLILPAEVLNLPNYELSSGSDFPSTKRLITDQAEKLAQERKRKFSFPTVLSGTFNLNPPPTIGPQAGTIASDLFNPEGSVWVKDGNLTIQGLTVLNRGTIIVRNGDVLVDGPIRYGASQARSTSFGLIVLNGNLHFSANAADVVGAYFASGTISID